MGEHAADFAVLAFGQRDFEPAVLFAFAVEGCALGVHELFALAEDAGRDVESCFHFREVVGGGVAFDLHAVDFQVGLLVDSIACGSRMTAGLTQQCVCPLRVVGEQEQAFARGIEAAHRRYVRYGLAGEHLGVLLAEQVHHGLAALLVACGSDDAAGLVHCEVELLGGLDGRAVHCDFVILVGRRFGIAHDFTTQRNPALADQVFCDAPATEPALGNHAGDAVGFDPVILMACAHLNCHARLRAGTSLCWFEMEIPAGVYPAPDAGRE